MTRKAQLIVDGVIPESMGTPSADQLTGTAMENLGELACRICYDSLGKGRSSEKLHEHILAVDNSSVYEHCVFTVAFNNNTNLSFLRALINRKGVFVEYDHYGRVLVTINLRAILKWDRCSTTINKTIDNGLLRDTLVAFGHELAPRIIREVGDVHYDCTLINEDLDDNQQWLSMYLYGSRGFSHEQVRHRFAISQRSTRYVDEDKSEYVLHPLLNKFINDPEVGMKDRLFVSANQKQAETHDKQAYCMIVTVLEKYLLDRGVDKLTARKQARAAGRGSLGNALATEMIYSAPISGWKWILSQRANAAADQEIRLVYNDVLSELQASRYSRRFVVFELIDAPDGIGKVLK